MFALAYVNFRERAENKNTSRKIFIHCGQLTLRKISKYVPTSCHISRLNCTTFDFRWGSAPDLGGGAYSYMNYSAPLAVFQGPASKGRKGTEEWRGIF